MNATTDLEEWAEGGHRAIRAMVERLEGDTAAFDRDPLSALGTLNDFVGRLPLAEFEEDDRVWLTTQLAAYLAEVLIRVHTGRWEALPGPPGGPGTLYRVAVQAADGTTRHVDPFKIVHQELLPVPQRIERMLHRALDAAAPR